MLQVMKPMKMIMLLLHHRLLLQLVAVRISFPSCSGFVLQPASRSSAVSKRDAQSSCSGFIIQPSSRSSDGACILLASASSSSAAAPAPAPAPALEQEVNRKFIIPSNLDQEMPLPHALFTLFPGGFSSMSQVRKLIRKDRVLVNGKEKNCQDVVVRDDEITIIPPAPILDRRGQPKVAKKIKIVYEDDHLAVIVKPAGVACHGTGNYSLVDRYAEFLRPTPMIEDAIKPVHAHRLDAPVGGLLIVAKSRNALRGLSFAFEGREVKKTYHAIVIGQPEVLEGSITMPIDGKEALTRYKVTGISPSLNFGFLTQVELWPETGRKHQLRRHMAHLRAPILGDLRYGPDNTLKTRGLFLFSKELAFTHPTTGALMSLNTSLPEIYQNTINMERRRAERQGEKDHPDR